MLVVLSIALVGRINDVLALLVYSPCGWFFFFFCLDTKEEEPRRKNQGYVSGPTAERSVLFHVSEITGNTKITDVAKL